jgi:hypothetical protein
VAGLSFEDFARSRIKRELGTIRRRLSRRAKQIKPNVFAFGAPIDEFPDDRTAKIRGYHGKTDATVEVYTLRGAAPTRRFTDPTPAESIDALFDVATPGERRVMEVMLGSPGGRKQVEASLILDCSKSNVNQRLGDLRKRVQAIEAQEEKEAEEVRNGKRPAPNRRDRRTGRKADRCRPRGAVDDRALEAEREVEAALRWEVVATLDNGMEVRARDGMVMVFDRGSCLGVYDEAHPPVARPLPKYGSGRGVWLDLSHLDTEAQKKARERREAREARERSREGKPRRLAPWLIRSLVDPDSFFGVTASDPDSPSPPETESLNE